MTHPIPHRVRASAHLAGILLSLTAGAFSAALTGCSDEEAAPAQTDDGGITEAGAAEPLRFTDELSQGGTVPPRHKCPSSVVGGGMGDNLSPPLSWAGGPTGTQSFALVLEDTRYGFFHWALWDIPADVFELPEGIPAGFDVAEPAGAHQASRQADAPHAYFGPCSDPGAFAGVYEYRLYALDVASLQLSADADSEAILEAIEAAALESVIWEAEPG